MEPFDTRKDQPDNTGLPAFHLFDFEGLQVIEHGMVFIQRLQMVATYR